MKENMLQTNNKNHQKPNDNSSEWWETEELEKTIFQWIAICLPQLIEILNQTSSLEQNPDERETQRKQKDQSFLVKVYLSS